MEANNPSANVGDTGDVGSVPGSGRSPGEGAWRPIPVLLPGAFHGHRSLWAIVHGVTCLSD